jgi:uncharacterized membrane protein
MDVQPLAKPLDGAAKIPKKTKSLMEKFTDFISRFLGSWWAVIFHTLWFSFWLIFDFDINLLTFSVSLEAIFIGIFLLMAANKAELKRDLHEARLRKRDREKLEHDIKLDEKADRQLVEIKRVQQNLAQEMSRIKKELAKLQS